MTIKHRILRASTQLAKSHVALPGQLVMDTDLNIVYVHDGVKPGGYALGLTRDVVQGMIDAAGFSAADKAKVQAISDKLNSLGTMAYGNFKQAPYVNLMPDSGRFAAKMNPLALQCGAFQVSTFLQAYNGATFSDGGKFTYNNSTNGGSGAALPETVTSLLTAMNNASRRYGVEFNVLHAVAGANPNDSSSGISVGGKSYYLQTINGAKAFFGADSYCTFAAWIRCTSGGFLVPAGSRLDGVDVLTDQLMPAGWHHVVVWRQSAIGYDNAFPYLRALPSSVYDIALPSFFNGKTDPGIYLAPLASLNELSA